MRRAGLTDLTAFLAVAEHRSFRRAAAALAVSPSALSHALRGLEERVGVRLLHRTTRSVGLTEPGRRLLDRVAPAMRTIDEALVEVGEAGERLSGRIRINAMEGGALALLAPAVVHFVEHHPSVEIEIATDVALVDIVAAGFDAGVRLREAVPQDMVAVPIGPSSAFAAVASPGYFAQRPKPTMPADLLAHRCIRFRLASGALFRWDFEKRGLPALVDVPGSLTVDNLTVATEAALQGAGIAWIPWARAVDHVANGRLVRVLEDWSPTFPGLCLYYPGRRHLPKAFTAFVERIRLEADAG